MAAADPPKSPEPEKNPEKEGQPSGESSGSVESGTSGVRGDVAGLEGQRGDAEQAAEARVSSGGGGSTERPGLSDATSSTGARSPSRGFAEDNTDEKTKSLSGNGRTFDWSESEEMEDEARSPPEDAADCDPENDTQKPELVHQDSHVNNITSNTDTVHEKKSSFLSEKSADMAPCEDLTDEDTVDAVDEDSEAAGEDNTKLSARNNNLGMMCKDCGMKFDRLESFNLHRHFHTQEDELTCKECGLSFQDSSSLTKHISQHKEEKEEQVASPKSEDKAKEEGSFQCAECRKIFSTVQKLRDHNCSNTVEKPYHCALCRQDFQFKVSVTKHMMSHSQESVFTCQECNQCFANTTALRIHQRSHSALKPYECPDCGMVFKHYYVMEDHRRRHTESTHSHLCNICGKTFKYTSLFHQHQYLHTGQKPFSCPHCGKKFAFAQNLKAHCRQHRKHEANSVREQISEQSLDIELEKSRGLEKENTHQSKENKSTFTCPVCPQTFSSSANLRAHMFVHEAENETPEKTVRLPNEIRNWEKGHTCPHCPCIYRDESSLNVHILSVHKPLAYLKKLSGPSNQHFSSLNNNSEPTKLKSQGTALGNKSYKCTECGKSFRHRSVLELHMRIHSKGRPYQCKICGKDFRCSSYLQQHVIIHTGKRPYKCPDCGKDFAFLQNMKTHRKLHQEKPFRCTRCRKGYSDETQLQQHMLSHSSEKPHKCDLCDKSFGLAYLLRDHMNTHTGERPHRCEECHKSFSWFSSLLVHQKTHSRKRQSLNYYGSFQTSARMRGRGNRGRRGGRLMWGQMRSIGGSGIANQQGQSYPVSEQRDAELNRKAVESPSSLVSSTDSQSTQQEELPSSTQRHQPVQWKVDGGEVLPVLPSQPQKAAPQQMQLESPILLLQRSGNRTDVPNSGSDTVQGSDSSHIKESISSAVSSHLASMPLKSSTSAPSEMTQHRQQPSITWSNIPTSIAIASTSSGRHGVSIPSSYGDGAALWSVRPALVTNSQSAPKKQGQELQPTIWSVTELSSQKEPSTHSQKERVVVLTSTQSVPSTVSQPEKPKNGCEPPKPQASCLTGASSSTQKDQNTVKPVPSPVTQGVSNTVWSIKTPQGIPNILNHTDTKVNTSDFQLPVQPGWANLQTTQKVPISIHYDGLGQRIGTPVWSFQSGPVPQQTLLTAPLKTGTRPELQPQPLVTGTQIIINQASPFFTSPLTPIPPLALPGPHPLHSVAVGALQRPPQPNIFFAPQAVMGERPHMTQTRPLPQLALQTEPPKLGPRLHFPPERLLQCMICGCTLPRELDLQMHYLQHAQGEI